MPVPRWESVPEPVTAPVKETASERSKASRAPAATATSPPIEPACAPSPTASTPAATVVPPVYVFGPVSTRLPGPAFVSPAVPASGAAIVATSVSATSIVLAWAVAPASVSVPPESV